MMRTLNKIRFISPVCRLKRMGKNKTKMKYGRDNYISDDEDFTMDMVYSSYSPSAPSSQFFSNMKGGSKHIVKPRNKTQEEYLKLLESSKPSIIIASGPAGVAKTYLCNAIGIQKLLHGEVEKLVITRPAVSVDEEHGFLPGTLEDKMDPWLRPIYDVFHNFVSPVQVKNMISKQEIEICPLAYMRGRTFDNAFICADEMQNSTPQQMLMISTRIGKNSKLVITGDPYQHDRGYGENGFADFITKYKTAIHNNNNSELQNEIQLIEFTEKDVERSNAVKVILSLYNTKFP